MRIISIVTILFITAAVGFIIPAFKEEVFMGKLVIKGPCGQRVVSVISPKSNHIKVQDNWQDPVTGESYQQVFSVRNFCELSSLEEGETFSFKFIKMKMSVCPTCLVYRPVPEADGAIVIVSKGSKDLYRSIKIR